MQQSFKYFLVLLLLTLLTVPVYAQNIDSSDMKKVTLQLLWKNQAQFAGYYVAKEKGFYRDAGLDVAIQEYDLGMNVTEDVLSGKVDFGVGRSSLVLEKMEGKDLYLLAAIFQNSPFILLTQEREDITKVTDLKGKRIMVTDDVVGMAALSSMLLSNRVTPESYTPQKHSFNVDDLITGNTDAMAAYISNESFQMQKQGVEYTEFSPSDYGIDFYSDILFTSKRFQDKDPALVERFRQASLKGWKYAFENIDELTDIILSKYNTQDRSREALIFEATTLKKLAYRAGTPLGHIGKDQIADIARTYRLLGFTKANLDQGGFYATRSENVVLTQEERNWIVGRSARVIVGVEMDWPPFDFIKNNQATGYSNELLRVAAGKVNLPVQFISGRSWAELMDQFDSGEIDILPAIYSTAERKKTYAFTGAYTDNPSVLVAREDAQKIQGLDDLSGKAVASIVGFVTAELIQQRYPDITLVPVGDVFEGLKAVTLGKADVFIGSHGVVSYILKNHDIPNVRIVDEVNLKRRDETALHMAVLKKQAILRDILQKGLDAVSEAEKDELHKQWLDARLGIVTNKVELSLNEKKWLRSHKNVRVAGLKDFPPFHYVEENGNYGGIAVDMLRILAERCGFEIKPTFGSWTEGLEAVKEGKLDILPEVVDTPARQDFLAFTKPVLTVPHVLAVKHNSSISTARDLVGKKLVLEKGYYTVGFAKKKLPGVEIVEVATTIDALVAVTTGEADAYLGNVALVAYETEKSFLTGLTTLPFNDLGPLKLSMGVRKDWAPMIPILEKGLASISPAQRREIQSYYFHQEDQPEKYDLDLTEEELAWIAANPTLEVAAVEWPPFEFDNEDGDREGIDHDVFKLATSRVGLKFNLVRDNWGNLLSMLSSGKLDISPSIYQTPERDKSISFTEPFISSNDAIFTREDSKGISNLEDLEGKTLAIERSYYSLEFIRTNHPGIKIHEVGTTLDALKALATGQVDAYFGSQTVTNYLINKYAISDLKVTGYYKGDPTEVRMGVPHDRKILRDIMQKALDSITSEEIRNIQKRYISIDDFSDEPEIELTRNEKVWLREHRTMNMGVDPSFFPYDFVDLKGSHGGVSSEYLDYFSRKLKVQLDLAEGLTWSEMINEAKKGKIDVIPCIMASPEREEFLLFTEPYMSSSVVIFTLKSGVLVNGLSDFNGKQMAVVKDSYTQESLVRDYPDIELKVFSSPEQALRALSDGSVDAFADELVSSGYIIEHLGLNNLKVAASTEYEIDLAMGVRKDWPELVNILNKGFDVITPEMASEFRQSWMSLTFEYKTDIKTILAWGAPIVGGLALIIFVVIGWNRRLGSEIADRKTAEAKIRAMSDASHDAVIMINGQGEVMFWNSAATRMFEFTAEEAMGQNMHHLFVPEEIREKALVGVEEFAKAGMGPLIGNVIEHTAQTKSGRSFPVEIAISSFELDGAWYAVGAVRDITERKEADEALKRSEQRFRSYFEHAQVGMSVTHPDKGWLEVNPRQQEILGYSLEELRNLTWSEMTHPDDIDADMFLYNQMFAGDIDHYSMEKRYFRKGGNVVYTDLSVSCMRDDDGTVTLVLASVLDISKRKQMELDLIEAQAETEDALAVVTSSIQYASRIQRSMLPPEGMLDKFTSDHFIVWEPRDVVGGDLYWSEPWGRGYFIMLGDCTGHGVPGAFMTLISSGALERALLEVPPGDSARLVSRMHQMIQTQLGQHVEDKEQTGSDDGLELGVCFIPKSGKKITFAGARMPLFVDNGKSIDIIKSDKKGIAYRGIPFDFEYTNHEIDVTDKLTFFMTTDGIIDQVGGEKGRGFGKKRFIALIESLRGTPLQSQGEKIYAELLVYEGEEKRRDDVSIVGFEL